MLGRYAAFYPVAKTAKVYDEISKDIIYLPPKLSPRSSSCVNEDAPLDYFSILPPEIKLSIFKYLAPTEVLVASNVCTEWLAFITDSVVGGLLWKEIYGLCFGGPKLPNLSYKAACLEIVLEMKKRFRCDNSICSANDRLVAGLKLCWAARYGHHCMAASLLEAWGDEIKNGWFLQQESQLLASPLFLAAQEGQIKTIELLLSHKVNVNSAAEDDGSTPLLIATQGHHVDAVELLLRNSANPNSTRGDGVTPLYIAAQNGFVELIKPLLLAQADPRLAVAADGATPLFIAAQNGHAKSVELLLQYGTNPDTPRFDGVTPLFIAAQNGHLSVVEELLKKADVNNATFHGATALFIACFKGNVDIARLLLRNRANVNLACDDGATCLYIASKNGKKEIIEILFNQSNPDINATYYDGTTPLMAAAERGDLEIVTMLLRARVNRNQQRADGHTAYSLAQLHHHTPIMNLLVPPPL